MFRLFEKAIIRLVVVSIRVLRIFPGGGVKGGRYVGLTILTPSCAVCLVILAALTFWNPKGASHTHSGFLPESDPAPVVQFFTRTGIAAAGGQFDFERCTR